MSLPRHNNTNLYDQLSTSLSKLRSMCVNYQSQLIEQLITDPKSRSDQLTAILDHPNSSTEDLFALIELLQHEKHPAGNFAGKLDIQLRAGVWSITKDDFLEKLTIDDIAIIHARLRNGFSEKDMRDILQGLLIKKFDALLQVEEK